ncbi:MAG: hypothetical protein VXZ96_13285 [Myxococcota bacterium]|nr:hypothetical protein [Myxococcota bacterium]
MTWLMLVSAMVHAEPMELRVAIDDRDAKRYAQPILNLGSLRADFTDDGAVPGDVPGDGIWVATAQIDKTERIEIKITDDNVSPFSMAYSLPQASIATIQFRSQSGDIPLAIDQNAPPMPTEGPKAVETLLVRAAPVKDAPNPEGNAQEIRFLVDDRQLQTLVEPRVRANQSGVAMAPLVDDGRVLGDTPGDNVYHAKLLVVPTEQLILTLEDQGKVLGQVTISLPADRVVGAGVQIGTSGLQLVTNAQTMAPTATVETAQVEAEVVPLNVVEAQQVSRDFVVQAFSKEGVGPSEQIDGKDAQWLELMLASKTTMVMPTFQFGNQDVLLSDDGSQFQDVANDGLYVGRVLVEKGGTLEGKLMVDGESRGQMTIFLPESDVAQAVATVTINGFAPFDRLESLKMTESALPTVFKVAETQGSDEGPVGELTDTVSLQFLLKGVFDSVPQVVVKEQGEALSTFQLKAQSDDFWGGNVDLPRVNVWNFQIKIDGGLIEAYVIPSSSSKAALVFEIVDGALSAIEDVNPLGEGSGVGQLKVMRATSQDGAQPAELGQPMKLTLRLDDRAGQMVQNAKLWVEGTGTESFFALDDGQNGDSEAGDQIYTATLEVDYKPLIQLGFQNGSSEPVNSMVMLPESGPAELRALVTSVGLTTADAQNADITVSAPLVVQAAPTGVDIQEGNGENFIEVTMILDDRILQKLNKPRLRVLQSETTVVDLIDDGTGVDEGASDQIYSAQFSVEQAEFLKVAIDDAGNPVGQLTVFLPSSSSARIRMRTTDEASGLKLLTEAIATGGGDAPSPVMTTGSGNSTGNVGVDRLAHVLWVGITLFGLAFTYLRHMVNRKWDTEVKPLLSRLEHFLEQAEQSDPINKLEDNDD